MKPPTPIAHEQAAPWVDNQIAEWIDPILQRHAPPG
jgi:hypothetical protein